MSGLNISHIKVGNTPEDKIQDQQFLIHLTCKNRSTINNEKMKTKIPKDNTYQSNGLKKINFRNNLLKTS